MVSFFKKKVTASELAIALLQNVTCSDVNSTLDQLQLGTLRERVHDELRYLLVFVVDYAIKINLGNDSPETIAIMNAYYDNLDEMVKNNKFPTDFYKNFRDHVPAYANAVNTPHENGVPYTVGKKFSELCVYHPDILLITAGSSIFSGQFASISEIFKTWKVVL